MLTKTTRQRILALSACFITTGIPVYAQGGTQETTIPQKMMLTVTSPQTQYSVQDPVVVDVHMVSHFNKHVFIDDYASLLKHGDIAVTTSEGKAVPLTAYGRSLMQSHKNKLNNITDKPSSGADLEPGQEAVYHVWLNRFFDLSLEGNYVITVTKLLPTAPEQTASYHAVVSNGLKITIIPPYVRPYTDNLGPDEKPVITPTPLPGQTIIHI